VTRNISTLLLFPLASLLAGCNSTDSLYAQGPWGPPSIRQNYPQYSSPWGQRISNKPPIISGAAYSSKYEPSVTHAELPITAHPYQRQTELPPDPQLFALAAAVSDTGGQIAPSSAPISQNPQLQASAQVPPPMESPPGVFTAPRRASSYAGTWKATDAKGGSCQIHLSSVASLDLYKASTSKCSNESLRNVNMWKLEGSRISLFSRGAEVANLEGSEASLNGALSKSGAQVRMLR